MNTIELRNKILDALSVYDEDSLVEGEIERRIDEVLVKSLKEAGVKLQFDLYGGMVIYNPPSVDIYDDNVKWIPAATSNKGFKVVVKSINGDEFDSNIYRLKSHLTGYKMTFLDSNSEYVPLLLNFYSTPSHTQTINNTIIAKVCENNIYADNPDEYIKHCEWMIVRLQQNGLYNIDCIDTRFSHSKSDNKVILHGEIESFIEKPRLLMGSDYEGTIITERDFCEYFETSYHALRLA